MIFNVAYIDIRHNAVDMYTVLIIIRVGMFMILHIFFLSCPIASIFT